MIDDTHTHIHTIICERIEGAVSNTLSQPQTTQKPSRRRQQSIGDTQAPAGARALAHNKKRKKSQAFATHRRCGIEKTLCQRAAQN